MADKAKGDSKQDVPGSEAGVSLIDRGFGVAENILYVSLSLLLVAGALVVLASGAHTMVTTLDEGVEIATTKTLDRLLLVFILVELLGAVRVTIREHKLLAEPFLIVGLIATIKGIIVILIDAKDHYGEGDKFDDSMTELGIIAGLVLVIAIAAFLLRRKEREPEE